MDDVISEGVLRSGTESSFHRPTIAHYCLLVLPQFTFIDPYLETHFAAGALQIPSLKEVCIQAENSCLRRILPWILIIVPSCV
jgi:hypothetical protein